MSKGSNDKDHVPDSGEIRLAVPWNQYLTGNAMKAARLLSRTPVDREQWLEEQDSRNTFGRASDDTALAFLRERTRVHETYIKEQERTKRIGIIASAILILGAAALILFAPAGRETLSYWIGAALVVFAAGAMGYQRIWGKSKNLSFGADQDRSDL